MEVINQMNITKLKNQQFGILLAVFSLLIFYFTEMPLSWFSLSFGCLIILIIFLNPMRLTPLTKFWLGLSITLSKLLSPIIFLLVYFLVITPLNLLCKLFNRPILLTKPNANFDSFWTLPSKSEFDPKRQF
jgi:hypothetical protein